MMYLLTIIQAQSFFISLFIFYKHACTCSGFTPAGAASHLSSTANSKTKPRAAKLNFSHQQLTKRPNASPDFKSKAAISFVSSFQYNTKSVRVCIPPLVPIPPKVKTNPRIQVGNALEEFFKIDAYRNSIFVGSGNMKCKELKVEKEEMILLQKRWEEEAVHFSHRHIAPPSFLHSTHEDDVTTTATSSLPSTPSLTQHSTPTSSTSGEHESCKLMELRVKTSFLVFTIYAIATLGVQLLEKDSSQIPEYQFVLLDEDFEAEGPAPLVWIFNQLTGKDKGSGRGRSRERGKGGRTNNLDSLEEPHMIHAFLNVYPSITTSKLRTRTEKASHAERMEVAFHATTRAEINIAFPDILLKVLPVPKGIIEHQGNEALRQNMERDVVPGVNAFRENFIAWKGKMGEDTF